MSKNRPLEVSREFLLRAALHYANELASENISLPDNDCRRMGTLVCLLGASESSGIPLPVERYKTFGFNEDMEFTRLGLAVSYAIEIGRGIVIVDKDSADGF